jgi:hypothetical protein
MIENIGISKGLGDVLCHMKIGSDNVHISRNGRHYYSSLNNRALIVSKSDKDLFNKGLPVLSAIIAVCCKKAGIEQLKWLPTTDPKKNNQMIGDAMKNITLNLKPIGIMVLDTVQDEIADQPCKEASKPNIIKGLEAYRGSLNEFGNNIECIKESSNVLLKTVLAKTMWGSKDMMVIINEGKDALGSIATDFNTVEECVEQSENRARMAQGYFQHKMATAQMKDVVGKIIENFSYLKSFMSRLAQDLQPLYRIDADFKSKVGYPATWFFNPSTFMNFTDEYDTLIDHMVKSASLESNIIEPLFAWKISTGAV